MGDRVVHQARFDRRRRRRLERGRIGRRGLLAPGLGAGQLGLEPRRGLDVVVRRVDGLGLVGLVQLQDVLVLRFGLGLRPAGSTAWRSGASAWVSAGASSSEMMRRMEARISSIVGSWAICSDMVVEAVSLGNMGAGAA